MINFLTVMMSLAGIIAVAWFVYRNDNPGNDRPDKTLLAMREDPPPETRGQGEGRPSAGRSAGPGRR